MPFRVANRVLESVSAPGSSAFSLAGAIAGFRRFSDIPSIALSDVTFYFAEGVDANGIPTGQWEVGIGTYSGTNVLTRTTVLDSSAGGATVNFTGTVYVGCGLPSSSSVYRDDSGGILLPAAAVEPGIPPAQAMYLYARELLPGHTAIKVRRPSGIDTPLQDAVSFNRLAKCMGSNNAVSAFGAANLTFAGTAAAVTPASGSCKSQTQRARYSSAATAGANTTHITPNAGAWPMFRGGVAGEGGFKYVLRFALQALQTGNRFFAGIAASTAAAAGAGIDLSTTAAPARIGVGFIASTGNWFLNVSNGTNITWSDLGANFPLNTNDMLELVLFARPFLVAAGDVSYRFRRYTTGSDVHAQEVSGTLNTNLPAATTNLYPWGFFSNNATAAAVSWEFVSAALETDW